VSSYVLRPALSMAGRSHTVCWTAERTFRSIVAVYILRSRTHRRIPIDV